MALCVDSHQPTNIFSCCQELLAQREARARGAQSKESVRIAVTTATSQSTPEKSLKKSRVETEGADVPKRGLWSNDADDDTPGQIWDQPTQPGPTFNSAQQLPPPPGLAQTGDMPDISDEVVALKVANQQLQHDKQYLQEQVAVLQEELAKLKIDGVAHESENAPGDQQAPASDEAARKRLARICARNSAGNHGLHDSMFWGPGSIRFNMLTKHVLNFKHHSHAYVLRLVHVGVPECLGTYKYLKRFTMNGVRVVAVVLGFKSCLPVLTLTRLGIVSFP